MTEKFPIPFDYQHATRHLSAGDERLARLISETLPFQLAEEAGQPPYEALLEAIVYQSISGKAAATIFARVKALGCEGCCPTPQKIVRLPDKTLREAGLSGAKAAAMKDLAQKTIEGIVPSLEQAHAMSDAELVERLDSVRGVGPWTVEMFLIFNLGRPDVLPIHDYGVQKGFAITYGKRKIPKPKDLLKFGERWRPFRTVASWFMWRAVERAGKDARKIKKAPPKSGKKLPTVKIAKKRITPKIAKKRAAKKRSK
ncbi:MAG: DNA-3-methyladenine glycosylase [Candidatus Acidiferrales bacterium]